MLLSLRKTGLALFKEVRVVKEGPDRTEFSTESRFGTEREIRYGGRKTLRNVLGNALF